MVAATAFYFVATALALLGAKSLRKDWIVEPVAG